MDIQIGLKWERSERFQGALPCQSLVVNGQHMYFEAIEVQEYDQDDQGDACYEAVVRDRQRDLERLMGIMGGGLVPKPLEGLSGLWVILAVPEGAGSPDLPLEPKKLSGVDSGATSVMYGGSNCQHPACIAARRSRIEQDLETPF